MTGDMDRSIDRADTDADYPWRVRLDGDPWDLEELANLLGVDGGERVVRADPHWYLEVGSLLSADEFARLDLASPGGADRYTQALLRRCEERVRELSGLARVHIAQGSPITFGGQLIERTETGRNQWQFVSDTLRIRSRVSASTARDGTSAGGSSSQTKDARRALADPDVARALRLVDRGTIVDYRKAMEIVYDDLGRGDRRRGARDVVDRAWATQDELEDLRATADNPALSGDEASHARSEPTTRAALTEPQALALISHVIRQWSGSRQPD